ncbi:MAG TPA: hypothetical protein VK925_03360, partial [Jiangellaceae bacterium]|nr:hypothetical protein [Jiangellaceae bacterium]
MPVIWTRYGAAAYDALRERVAEAKRDDPLAQATVLVPTQVCGVVVRRALAHGVAGHGGVAGLSVLTVDGLAERIAAPALVGSGRRPTVGPVLAAAWRRALDEDAGVFAPVAAHRATVRALVQAHRELREVDAAALDAIAGSGEAITADLVRLHHRVCAILADGWYDTTDLRRTAAATLRADTATPAAELGAVLLFLPQDLPPGAVALLDALAAAQDVPVIAALTGDARADAGVRQSVERLGRPQDPPPTVGSPT